jgi:phage shock protein PspC (stress-responsive transcriptional regulator)
MDRDEPTPKDLRAAAAVAQSMAYVTGLAGVLAGALVYRQGDVALAVVLWVLTFAAGALLMVAAFLARAIASVLARLTKLDGDVAVLLRDRAAEQPGVPPRDPYR